MKQEVTHQSEEVQTKARTKGTDVLVALFIFIASVIALIMVLGYDIVAARTPLVFLTPLLILSIIQLIRSSRNGGIVDAVEFIRDLASFENPNIKKGLEFLFGTVVLALLIFIAGHFVSMAIFLIGVLGFISKEKWRHVIIITAVMVVAFFFLFEYLFEVQLYRGMVYRLIRGYEIF